ncbi:MAG: MauE/DoxX family redox-associated membrane protein [Propioniciclava sp.]
MPPFADAVVLAPLAVALTFGSSAWLKRGQAPSILDAMRLLKVPAVLQKLSLARLVPVVEVVLALGLVLLPSPFFLVPAVGALGLALIYWILIARALTFERRPSCGCFGRIGEANISWRTLVRNSLVVLAAGISVMMGLWGTSAAQLLLAATGMAAAWLVGTALCLVLLWSILARTPVAPRARHSSRSPADSLPDPAILPAVDPAAYVRRPIPPGGFYGRHQFTTFAAAAALQARLILVMSRPCERCGRLLDDLDLLATRFPMLGVHVLFEGSGAAFVVAEWPQLVDYLMVADSAAAWQGLGGVSGQPVAVILGADGYLAGGPVVGEPAIRQLIEDLAVELGSLSDDSADQP